jgi:hypothetical protein
MRSKIGKRECARACSTHLKVSADCLLEFPLVEAAHREVKLLLRAAHIAQPSAHRSAASTRVGDVWTWCLKRFHARSAFACAWRVNAQAARETRARAARDAASECAHRAGGVCVCACVRRGRTHLTAKALPAGVICADAPCSAPLLRGPCSDGGATPPTSSASSRSGRPHMSAADRRKGGREIET